MKFGEHQILSLVLSLISIQSSVHWCTRDFDVLSVNLSGELSLKF